jgi:cell division protein YceG involved in septum cleavage
MGTPEFILFVYPVIFIVSVIILILTARIVFSIPTFLKYQKAQTKLLTEIAIEKGVAPKRINEILNEIKD